MSEGEIGIRPTRSQLIVKAIENFIQACQRREDLRGPIEVARSQMETGKVGNNSRVKSGQRLRVIPHAS
jgi:hypothetical protein